MEDQNNTSQILPGKPTRPTLLTVLCILSFIGSGLSGITFFAVYLSFEEIAPMLQELSSEFPGLEIFTGASKNFFLTGAILYLFSYIGINLMWRMKKAGLHFYAGAQVLIIFLPVVYIPNFPFPIMEALVSGIFIGLYAKHYKLFT